MSELSPVSSSNISAIGYDPATRVLRVRFTNGGTYAYADVPADAHAALLSAPSIGKAFSATCRGCYQATKES